MHFNNSRRVLRGFEPLRKRTLHGFALVATLDPALNDSFEGSGELMRSKGTFQPLNLQLTFAPLDSHVGCTWDKQVRVRFPTQPADPLRILRVFLDPMPQRRMLIDTALKKPADLVT